MKFLTCRILTQDPTFIARVAEARLPLAALVLTMNLTVALEVDNLLLLKGKLGNFVYLFKVFIGPKLRQVSKGNFHRKAPKWVKNQAKGSKIHKIRTLLLILSTDLLWESINSVLRATVGIHLYTRVDSHSRSEDRICG